MAAARKPAARRRESTVPLGIWVLLGLMVALLVAVLVVLLLRTPPQGGQPPDADESPAQETRDVRKDEPKEPVSAPRYEFYHLLPEETAPRPSPEEPAEDRSAGEPASEPPVPEEAPAEAARFILQVGAFRSRADAERRKAEVALQGFTSRIEEAQLEGRAIYRVVIGPVGGTEAASVERQLQDASIEPMRRRLP
ncbi:MAG: SPOR domain-containing protein [Halothiobacillaceae bacterium]